MRVAELAREARVSEATVFNYFPRKKDLRYSRLDDFGERLLAQVAAACRNVSATVGKRPNRSR